MLQLINFRNTGLINIPEFVRMRMELNFFQRAIAGKLILCEKLALLNEVFILIF